MRMAQSQTSVRAQDARLMLQTPVCTGDIVQFSLCLLDKGAFEPGSEIVLLLPSSPRKQRVSCPLPRLFRSERSKRKPRLGCFQHYRLQETPSHCTYLLPRGPRTPPAARTFPLATVIQKSDLTAFEKRHVLGSPTRHGTASKRSGCRPQAYARWLRTHPAEDLGRPHDTAPHPRGGASS